MQKSHQLSVSVGEYSDRGVKEINQDFHDIFIPTNHQLTTKGIAIAIADGISSSDVSQIASKTSVTSFLIDYFSTSELWSVKKSAYRVLSAANSWLYAQSAKGKFPHDKNRGFVCTFSAMIIRSNIAHLFHIGDTRVYRLREGILEQLTQDHRMFVSQEKSYLSRALGIEKILSVDYDTYEVYKGDYYLFMTDGVYEYIKEDILINTITNEKQTLQERAKTVSDIALENGSNDNLTIQILKIENLPQSDLKEIDKELLNRPLPPILESNMLFDGYKVIREISASSRSHAYLALDTDHEKSVVLKIPSVDLQNDKASLERFLLEDWIAKRMSNPYLLKAHEREKEKNYLYNVTEYIEGQTLAQWIIDNPKVDLQTARDIATQIAKGLQAMHRQELIHQDLRPENIIIDSTKTIKIIDYGSVKVTGISDINTLIEQQNMLGTMLYSAPEYFLSEVGSSKSDIFSLAVIVYQMVSGKFPYATDVAKSTSKSLQKKLKYRTLYSEDSNIPLWVDAAMKKALEPSPYKRYGELSEFIYDLKHPNEALLKEHNVPFVERNPLLVWQSISFALLIVVIILLIK